MEQPRISPAARLPVEVLDIIMVHVLQNHHDLRGVHAKKYNLQEASLVCKTWQISAQRILLGHWKISRVAGLRKLLNITNTSKAVPLRFLHLIFGFATKQDVSYLYAVGDLATEHIGSFQRFAQDIKQLFVVQAIFGRDERVLDFVKNAKQLRTLSLKFPVRNAGMRADLPRYFVQMHDLLDQYLATHTQLLYLHLKHIALSEGPGKRHAITLQFQLRQLLLVGCVISDSDLSALLTSQQYSLRSLGLSRIAGPSLSGFIEAVKVISCNLEELFLNLLPYKEPRGPGAPRTDSRAFLDMPICLQYGGFLPTNSLMGASAPILSQCQQLHTLELRDPLVQTTDLEQLLNVRRLHVFLTTKEGVPLDLPALLTRKQLPALQQLTISAHDAVWLPTASYGRYDVDQNMEDFERRMRNAPFTVEFRDLHNAEATSIALHHTLMMETEEECMATWQ